MVIQNLDQLVNIQEFVKTQLKSYLLRWTNNYSVTIGIPCIYPFKMNAITLKVGHKGAFQYAANQS